MKNIYYYHSPIGILKLVCSQTHLEELHFDAQEGPNPKVLPQIVATCKEQLDAYFGGGLKNFSIPVHFTSGSAFAQNVWHALERIPFGETTNYKAIAETIRQPKAIRAVGGANNKNPVPIIIPCHRVIETNGKLVGYAGGLDKKRWLLNHEKERKL